MVKLINAQNPDIILLVGDTFDEDLGPVIRNNMGQQLQMLRSKMGIFAVTGNHEYYGNPAVAVKYLEDHGIKVLQDTTVVVGGLLNLIGRNDRQSISMLHKQRKPLDELVKESNPKLPIVLMDHQPFHLEEAEQNGVTLQLSGHTHHGQMWPFNYITSAIFEVSHGFYKKGNTSYYVSTGYGTWGPPVRTGNRPEVVVITLE
jgi:predicted MPP superfamily phosphohydrolase